MFKVLLENWQVFTFVLTLCYFVIRDHEKVKKIDGCEKSLNDWKKALYDDKDGSLNYVLVKDMKPVIAEFRAAIAGADKNCERIEDVEGDIKEINNKLSDPGDCGFMTMKTHKLLCDKNKSDLELMIWTLLKSFKIELIRDLTMMKNGDLYTGGKKAND